ncbi:peptidyl-prolyl cis-trans isomerase, FKBP-type family protein [Histomonas meleagridis]|uniref:peptidyl-prolyl cis-trans isomerase, FKBP-type family protein n=1 Tax=Histomonas meleagridis TaxID=135588 RepID=UPI003559EEAD|nr:peptidyl-prolyl cis-trans isomerase, FKBP-type family protein [Histomonas meleagridis]KAH0796894.1 peptidyl-prolyl cis-trans isomerase, FKBP-type family protein [Histomonas meleagridis]
MSTEPIPLTEDGLITKTIIKEGNGPQPKDDEKVFVCYVGKLQSNNKEFENCGTKEQPFLLTIGKEIIEGCNIALKSMKVGEISSFTIDPKYGYGEKGKEPLVPPNETLVFEIELLEILHPKTPQDEGICKAIYQCQRGNAEFKQGDISRAISFYTEARLTLMFEAKEDMNSDDPKSESYEYKKVNNRLNRNLAVAHSKIGEYTQAIHFANEALLFESNDLKTLIRKLDAELKLKRVKDARQTFNHAIGCSPNEPTLKQYQAQLEKLEKEQNVRQDELFRNAFK